jgi:small subunit ribosomal protein S21
MAGPINVEVRLKDGETAERLIRRFSKKVKKVGVLDEYRDRMYYEKPSKTKRLKKIRRKKIAQKLQREKEAKYRD